MIFYLPVHLPLEVALKVTRLRYMRVAMRYYSATRVPLIVCMQSPYFAGVGDE
jgi:hypothetical protein